MIFAAGFAITVGLMILGQWIVTLAQKRVPAKDEGISGRGKREMLFHWGAESLASVSLVFAGITLLQRWSWARSVYLLAMGMLIYTVINSAGWFAERREWAMVCVFGALLIGAVVSLLYVL